MRVFATPALLAALSFAGLIVALLDDGLFDALGWLGLGIPVASIPLAAKYSFNASPCQLLRYRTATSPQDDPKAISAAHSSSSLNESTRKSRTLPPAPRHALRRFLVRMRLRPMNRDERRTISRRER